MQNVVNSLRGSVRVEIQGAYPERFMNMCAENNIEFWDLERIDDVTLRISMNIKGYTSMRPHLNNVMCTAKTISKEGAPFFLWRLRKRYALIVGLIGIIVLTWVMSLFVWDYTVEGNNKVSASDILEALDKYGVGIGTYGPSIDSETLRNEILLELPDLSWITVHVNGSKATVIVRERVEMPEMLDDSKPQSIVADKAGIIEKMTIFDGTTVRAVGDSVSEGDDIISGVMDSLSSGVRLVSARGEIYARTWYEFSAQMPVETEKKEYTGESNKKTSIIFGRNRINLYLDSGISYTNYDKITKEDFLTLPGGIVLPIKMAISTYNEYEAVVYEFTQEEAAQVLEDQLMAKLEQNIGEDGEIVNKKFDVLSENGIIKITLNAECIEQIGVARDLTNEESEIPDNTKEESGETQ